MILTEKVSLLRLSLQLSSVDGVMSFRDQHFWRHSSNVIAGILYVQVKAESSDQVVVSQVRDEMWFRIN